MNETMRPRVWLVVVLVLGVVNLSQCVTNRTLRTELDGSRAANTELGAQIEQRARSLIAESLRERRQDLIAAGSWLHSLYQSEGGLQRPEGLWLKGSPDFEGIAAWLFDVYLSERLLGTSDEAAKEKVLDAIKRSDEWRQKHPGGK